MSNDKAPEIPKDSRQGETPTAPTVNPSDREHTRIFNKSIGAAARAILGVRLPLSAKIAENIFPKTRELSEQDRSETIDTAVRRGHIDPAQAERLKKKLTQAEEPT